MLTIGSLFSGIGGLELGLEMSGLGPVLWQVEKDPFCRAVLETHWPGVERYVDVCALGGNDLAPVDLVCGGFPCQDVSAAGKGEGLRGRRSGLWFEFARICQEARPRWIVVENVASAAARWVDPVVAGLVELGYDALPIPLSASDVGAPHRRARIFIVAANALDGELRVERERLPGGRARGVRASGHAQPFRDGAPRPLADANGGGRGRIGLQTSGGLERASGRVLGGRGRAWADGRAESRSAGCGAGWWDAEPDLGRVADGVPARSHRLRARSSRSARK